MLVIAVGAAEAAEVVWLTAPLDADRLAVAAAAGASGPPLAPTDLRAAATRWTPADDEALDRLDAALRDARAFEARLDGELVILQDLAAPVAGVTALRDDADRQRLYAALAYQGFAVDRYFAETLATDERAEPWRVAYGGVIAVRPWVDALALEPDREITSYEIAEAPQRASYTSVQEATRAWLPGSLVPEALPAGATLVVDGRPSAPDAAGTVKVRAGRHLAHVEVATAQGSPPMILARWDVSVEPGGRVALRPALDDGTWALWLRSLAPGAPVPLAVADAVRALGGEVWIAKGAGKELELLSVTPDGVAAAALPDLERARSAPEGPALAFGAGAGWWFDDGFWLQDPFDVPNATSTVNAAAVLATVHARLPVGPLRLAAGADLAVPLGPHHVARVGDTPVRPRPHPWVGAGVEGALVTFGWVFPWHPAVGLVGAIPLPGPLELEPRLLAGIPRTIARGAAPYETGNLLAAGVSVAVRLD